MIRKKKNPEPDLFGAFSLANDNQAGPLPNDRGFALPLVLWVLVILMVIAEEYAFTMRVEGSATRNFKDEVSARQLAVSGVSLAAAEMTANYSIAAVDKDGKLVLFKREGRTFKPLKAGRALALEEGNVSYEIKDERGKININTAARGTIDELLMLSGVEKTERDEIIDSVLDWRDPNHEFHLNGAEDEHYSALPEPYGAKDGNLDTVEELLLIKGMTPEVFYGSLEVPERLSRGKGAGEGGYGGVARFFTTRGDGRININTATETVLTAALGKGKAQEILLRRETEGFFEQPVEGGMVSSDVFLVRSTGEVRGIRVAVRAVLEKRPGSTDVTISYWNEEGISPERRLPEPRER